MQPPGTYIRQEELCCVRDALVEFEFLVDLREDFAKRVAFLGKLHDSCTCAISLPVEIAVQLDNVAPQG